MRHDKSLQSDTYVFEIRSGLYQGVAQDLAGGRHVLGSGEDADLMLLEPHLAPLHAALVLDDGTVRVEGLADGIVVAGAGPVPAGSARTVRLPATITIGDLILSCRNHATAPVSAASPGARPPGGLRALFGRPAVPGLAAAAVLTVAVSLTLINPIAGAAVLFDGAARDAATRLSEAVGVDRAAASVDTDPGHHVPVPPQTPPAIQPPAPPLTGAKPAARPSKAPIDAAAEVLKEEAARAGLLNVHVSAGGGAVTASGSIEPGMTARWESLQKGFDERFAGDVTLVNSVAVKAEKLPASLGIEGVWRGAQPYILIRGQRYLVGAVVDGGWVIREIERDRVMLEREGRLVAMRF